MDFGNEDRSVLDRFHKAMVALPWVTADLPAVGGVIKATPEHFEVEEILPYEAGGEGEHLYVTLRRRGWNTPDVAAAMAERLDLSARDVGWGGRKDKQAVATQTFSLPWPLTRDPDAVTEALAPLSFEVLKVARHRNKIKTGHVAGNRFRIVLTGVDPEASGRAAAIVDALVRRGVPNFYGAQRFGLDLANLGRALALCRRPRPPRGNQEVFLVSVLQSALFNQWLAERMARGYYHTVLEGDVAQKTDTGGLFVVEDAAEAAERFARRAIVYTGPIFGHKMMPAAKTAAEWESRLLAACDMNRDLFKRLRAPGSRRRALLYLADLEVVPSDEGLCFSFTLPPGAYATVVMREFTRAPG